MAARGSLIYGASDTQVETNGAFVSADQGQSWQPLLSFDAIQAIDTCVKTSCQDDCQLRAGLGQWPSDVCDAVPSPRAVASDAGAGSITDGGATARDAGADAGARSPVDAGAMHAGGSGCHCAAAGDAAPVWSALGALPSAMLFVAFRRRSRAAREPRRAAAAR
jgi:hypothetical protein